MRGRSRRTHRRAQPSAAADEYLRAKVVPKREDRLGTCTAFDGTACGLKERWGGGCGMQELGRPFSQGAICQLIPAAAILNTIPDSIVIVHGAMGCGGVAHNYNASVRSRQMSEGAANPMGTRWLTTNLAERDVVNGGESKLEAAILDADRLYRPAAIFVVSSCVPGVIGDDIDGVADRLAPKVSGVIVPVHCEGFKTKVMATAYDSVYHAVAKHLIEGIEDHDEPLRVVDPELEDALEAIRRGRLVNLMNVSSMGENDEAELTRLLGALGLTVQVLPCFAHPEDMRLATEASLSVSTCPTHDDHFLSFLERGYGIPYLLKHMPIGVANTNEWVRAVAGHLGLEDAAEKLIGTETSALEAALAPLRPALEGRTAIVSAGEVRTLATAELLTELGMKVLAVRPYHFDRFGEVHLEGLIERQGDLEVDVGTAQPFEAVGTIQRTRPDVYLGHVADNVWAAKCGIPTLPIYGGPNTFVGYAGAFDIARRLARVMRNPAFNRRLAGRVRQPYRTDKGQGHVAAIVHPSRPG